MKKTAFLFCLSLVAWSAFAQQKVANIDQLLAYPEAQYTHPDGFQFIHTISENKSHCLLRIKDQRGKILSETMTLKREYVGKGEEIYTYTFSELSNENAQILLGVCEGQVGFSKGIDEGIKTFYVLTPDGTWQKKQEKRYHQKKLAN